MPTASEPAESNGPDGPAPARAVFRDVDAADGGDLVPMMDATDAWPAVRAARSWLLDQAGVGPGAVVADVGCGPGTFGAEARGRGATALDIDRSAVMLDALRRRHPDADALRAALPHLPVRTGGVDLVHIERVLQWTAEPDACLAELRRLVAPGGWLAVTDTDWATFAVDHPDPGAAARLSAAAQRWVPHPTLARSLVDRLGQLGTGAVAHRHDVVTLERWDPDAPRETDGPPGLPLRMIADAGPCAPDDVEALADRARHGRFAATLTLVTALARLDHA